jgi:hypothetical protein
MSAGTALSIKAGPPSTYEFQFTQPSGQVVSVDLPHQASGPRGNALFLCLRRALREIRHESITQVTRHAHIDELPTIVDHAVDARRARAPSAKLFAKLAKLADQIK